MSTPAKNQSDAVDRIDIRLSPEDKQRIKRAQKISGHKTLSAYMLHLVKKDVDELLAREDAILWSQRDRKIFFDALDNPPKANAKLKAAVKGFAQSDNP